MSNTLPIDPITEALSASLAPHILREFNKTGSVSSSDLLGMYITNSDFHDQINGTDMNDEFERVASELLDSGIPDNDLGVVAHGDFKVSLSDKTCQKASDLLIPYLKENYPESNFL